MWQTLNVIISFAIVAVLFAMIYKYLPDARIMWKDVWIGAAVTAALFITGKHAIGLYLWQTAMASTFGAAGSFAVLLVWVYYSALISFFGAEFTHVLQVYAGEQFALEVSAEFRGRFVRADKLQTIAAAYNAWMRKTSK